jgi:hypothetical protein
LPYLQDQLWQLPAATGIGDKSKSAGCRKVNRDSNYHTKSPCSADCQKPAVGNGSFHRHALSIPGVRGLCQELKGNNPDGFRLRRDLVKSPAGHGVFTRLGEEPCCLQRKVWCNLLIINNNESVPHSGMLIAVFLSGYGYLNPG